MTSPLEKLKFTNSSPIRYPKQKIAKKQGKKWRMWQWEATFKVYISQNVTTLFAVCARDYLKPREGGLLLVLSKKIDVVVISMPEEITCSVRAQQLAIIVILVYFSENNWTNRME